MKNIFAKLKRKKLFLLLLLFLIILIFIMGVYFLKRHNDQTGRTRPQPQTEQNTSNKETNLPSKEKNSPPTSSPSTNQSKPSAIFGVSSIKLHEPQYSSVQDKLGSSHTICRLNAEITTTGAGVVKYYWQTHHPQYYSPSSNGPELSIEFPGADTKIISLDTYLSNDSRHFSLFIISPGQTSKATADKVWCPAQ